MPQPLSDLVYEIAQLLKRLETRIVFAESCTGGLVSAALARVPGISEHLCGSAVVYRLDTKTRWLDVPNRLLLDPGPVSEPVARAMALGALRRTPEAHLAAAITGHLGPNAPVEQDGKIFIAITRREMTLPDNVTVTVIEERLPEDFPDVFTAFGETVRERRQWVAVERVLSCVRDELAQR